MRRGAQGKRRDATEPAVMDALRSCGWVVRQVSADGLPDLVCFRRGVTKVVEVKVPGKALTKAQADLYAVAPFDVVESVDDVLNLGWVR